MEFELTKKQREAATKKVAEAEQEEALARADDIDTRGKGALTKAQKKELEEEGKEEDKFKVVAGKELRLFIRHVWDNSWAQGYRALKNALDASMFDGDEDGKTTALAELERIGPLTWKHILNPGSFPE